MRTQLGPLDTIRIPIHAQLPIRAHGLQGRQPAVTGAAILDVALGAGGHLGEGLGGGVLAGAVDVGLDGGTEGVDGVEAAEDDGRVEEEL